METPRAQYLFFTFYFANTLATSRRLDIHFEVLKYYSQFFSYVRKHITKFLTCYKSQPQLINAP